MLLALLIAMLVVLSSIETYPHALRGDEIKHMNAAIKFVTEFQYTNARNPSQVEFGQWMVKMDHMNGYRFDGIGFSISDRCSDKKTDYCFSFWTGEAFGTYKSWEKEKGVFATSDSNSSLVPRVQFTIFAMGLACLSIIIFLAARGEIVVAKPSSGFWAKVTPHIERRLNVWKQKSFHELVALPESTSDGHQDIEGHSVSFDAMYWQRDPESVILMIRASVQVGWRGRCGYELGFVMAPSGEVRTASEKELASLRDFIPISISS